MNSKRGIIILQIYKRYNYLIVNSLDCKKVVRIFGDLANKNGKADLSLVTRLGSPFSKGMYRFVFVATGSFIF